MKEEEIGGGVKLERPEEMVSTVCVCEHERKRDVFPRREIFWKSKTKCCVEKEGIRNQNIWSDQLNSQHSNLLLI